MFCVAKQRALHSPGNTLHRGVSFGPCRLGHDTFPLRMGHRATDVGLGVARCMASVRGHRYSRHDEPDHRCFAGKTRRPASRELGEPAEGCGFLRPRIVLPRVASSPCFTLVPLRRPSATIVAVDTVCVQDVLFRSVDSKPAAAVVGNMA